MALTSKELIARLSSERQQKVLAKSAEINAQRAEARRLQQESLKQKSGYIRNAV